MKDLKVYFPNLNGLRFIAALLVIIHHIEQIKYLFNMPNYYMTIPFVSVIGKLGVVLFFVLSGFLITYLLLHEEHIYQKISIKKFYIRRVLRIWPLYFLIITLGFCVFPNVNSFAVPNVSNAQIFEDLPIKLALFLFFLPNMVLSIYGAIPYVSHSWSIGTEEQYYLVWPLIFSYFKKNRILVMVVIILFYLIVNYFLKSEFVSNLSFGVILKKFWASFSIDCMAIGGLLAICLYQENRFNKIILNNTLFYSVLFITIILIFNGVHFSSFHYEIYAILFGIIIVNFAANKNIAISLENGYLNYLGNISYGLYMYHPIGIVASLIITKAINQTTNWLIYPISIIITILLAGISYKYFEAYFLKFKKKYSKLG